MFLGLTLGLKRLKIISTLGLELYKEALPSACMRIGMVVCTADEYVKHVYVRVKIMGIGHRRMHIYRCNQHMHTYVRKYVT